MTENEVKLTVEIKNKSQVELIDLTKSLLALGDEFKRFVNKTEEDGPATENVKLYIKEIRSGSIIADLIALAVGALPLIENANTVVGFASYLKKSFDYLLGKNNKKPDLEKANYENFKQILEPVAKDNGSQMNINAINFHAPVYLQIPSVEANAVQNAAARELLALQDPTAHLHEKVLLYWYQARNDTKNKNGDKAIIESIYKSPIKTVFVNEMIKEKILSSSENPFTMGYVVDVSVETIQNRPALYRILDMYDTVEQECA